MKQRKKLIYAKMVKVLQYMPSLLAEVDKGLSKTMYLLEKSVINTIWQLLLPICNWPNIMIGLGSLLLVVPTYLQFQF
jgi:hypothetical protein